MGAGAFIEPGVVVAFLFGGTWVNRNTNYNMSRRSKPNAHRSDLIDAQEDLPCSPASDTHSTDGLLEWRSSESSSPSLLLSRQLVSTWRRREIRVLGFRMEITSPNTRVFKDRLMSRLLQKFPFLVEAWYWALIYWVYQIGRGFSAITLVEGTVHVARQHALQIIHLEQSLRLFHEIQIQTFLMQYPTLMHWVNRIYSFIHIPGTILFLVWLFYYTTTRNRLVELQFSKPIGIVAGSPAGPRLYEARRRTMATCNLIAFIVFTLWPCMPPRLLNDKTVTGPSGEEARSYGFIDTVHSASGESSVWTQNRFCNQYAAMPSLHFGYSLLIGLTVMSIPLSPQHSRSRTTAIHFNGSNITLRRPSWRRVVCVIAGVAYPFIILVAIIATANHFILDAVAGAMVCGLAWTGNRVLLNLLALEDYFLWLMRIHKPEAGVLEWEEGEYRDERVIGKGVVV